MGRLQKSIKRAVHGAVTGRHLPQEPDPQLSQGRLADQWMLSKSGISETGRIRREAEAKLIHAQECERTRIAQELHDDFTQRLAMLSLEVDQLRTRPSAGRVVRQGLKLIHRRIEGLADDIRRFAYRLHPPILEQLGLAEALKSLAEDVAAQTAIQIRFTCRVPPKDISKHKAICLYRVAQEALQNLAKHSHANSAEVSLATEGSNVRLTIRDSGVGFDPGSLARREGLGLASMRERVRVIGGKFQMHSSPGKGTVVSLLAPLSENFPRLQLRPGPGRSLTAERERPPARRTPAGKLTRFGMSLAPFQPSEIKLAAVSGIQA